MSQVIKNPVMASGARKLSHQAKVVAPLEAAVADEPIQVKLKREFATELEQLRRETQELARAEASRELVAEQKKLIERIQAEAEQRKSSDEAKLQARLIEINNLIAECATARKDLLLECESIALDIAYSALIRIVGDAENYRQLLSGAVSTCLASIKESHELHLRMHPKDIEFISASVSDAVEGFNLVPDDSLPAGSCKITTKKETIDASLIGQLERVRQILMSRYRP